MSSVMRFPLGALLLLASMGCWSSKTPVIASNPLSMDEWKKMPPAAKYQVDNLERLKEGNPRLNEPEAWENFVEEVVLPAKQQGR